MDADSGRHSSKFFASEGQRRLVRGRPLLAAGSTGQRNTFRELVCWGLIEQGLSGSFVELPCYRAEFGLAM
jgi:hypothetical protein